MHLNLHRNIRHNILWRAHGWLISLCLLLPIISLIIASFMVTEDLWYHIITNLLPRQLVTSLLFAGGVALFTAMMGAIPAWLICCFNVPGRRFLSWALLLPLSLPTYIAAYSYGDMLDYASPFFALWQEFLPTTLYPNLQSLYGGIFIFSLVLYPYVYITARASFLQQSGELIESARLLGLTPRMCFFKIALPLARPAIFIGMTLAIMEAMNDLGAVEFLGIQTLTMGIYNIWLSHNNFAGAAQLSLILLGLMFSLFYFEQSQRGKRGFQPGSKTHRTTSRFILSPRQKIIAFIACFLPILFGFLLPVGFLVTHVFTTTNEFINISEVSFNTFMLALLASLVILPIALLLAFSQRIIGKTSAMTRLASLGYAIPATVLAVGILGCVYFVQEQFGVLLSGSIALLIFAYMIRFMAIAFGTIESAYTGLTQNLDMAARASGASSFRLLSRIHLPLMRIPLLAGFLLVSVETIKELPATLILRPFNFETLATSVYNYASLGQIEEAALPALIIIGFSMIPIIVMVKLLDHYTR